MKDGGYGSVYINCHPFLLVMGEVNIGDSANDYMGALINADTPGLASFNAVLPLCPASTRL